MELIKLHSALEVCVITEIVGLVSNLMLFVVYTYRNSYIYFVVMQCEQIIEETKK